MNGIRLETDFQTKTTIKYQTLCFQQGFFYLDRYVVKNVASRTTIVKCMCRCCKSICDFDCGNLMKGEVKCKTCLVNKYKEKASEMGYEYIDKYNIKTQTYIKCKCLTCNCVNNYPLGNLMNGKIRCENCLINKYKEKASEMGYEYVSKYFEKHTIIKCKCLKCESVIDFNCGNLMKGEVKCETCLVNKYKEKASEMGYEYVSKHWDKNTFVKCKCLKCESVIDFKSGAFMNNSIRCKCEKKQYIRGFIYKLSIGGYWYIGMTDTTIVCRYNGHIRGCFNRRKRQYHSKKYMIIRRELSRITGKSVGKLTRGDFRKYVKVQQVAVNKTSKKDLKALESQLICLDNPWCMNSCY